MRGLLLKDWYTLIKTMRLMLLILVIWACIPGFSFAPFVVFYAAMLPVTALAYDERSKWDELAVMMPYSAKDIVLSKYALGLLCVGAATVIAFIAQFVLSLVGIVEFDFAEFAALLLIACLALILLALNLPLMFRMGVEKGRIALMILICAGVMGSMALRDSLLAKISSVPNIGIPLLGLVLVTVLVYALSAPLSVSLYSKKKG